VRCKRLLYLSCLALAAGGIGAAPAAGASTVIWHMNEPTGSTVMLDANGKHPGAIHNVRLGAPGLAGLAYEFPGSSWVDVPSAPDLNPGAAPFTVTISLNATRTPVNPDWDLVRKGVGTTAGGNFKVEYQPTGQATCGIKGTLRTVEITAGPPLNDGQWHTVKCVKTASAVRLVVDGQATTRSVAVGSVSNGAKLFVASHTGTSEFFRGRLDELSMVIG
jgi:Concanavalin A-like lectin/glucanases superfamily